MGILLGMKHIQPDKWVVSPEILSLIGEIDEFKGKWTATQALAPDRLAALRQVATVESVGSSTRIEGVKLTNSEVEALLRGVKTYSFRSRDEQEVAGYAEVMELIFSSYEEMSVTENHIKQLHGILLRHSSKDERHRGEYKKFQNHVEAFGPDGKSKGVIFQTASPFETPKLMRELVEWTNSQFEAKRLHPLLIIATFVVVFLQIHPFQDGNGRLSRSLTTMLLLRFGYLYVPYSSMERVIEESKEGYYLALRKAQVELDQAREDDEATATNGFMSWVLFFLRSMQKQKASLEKKLEDELVVAKMPRLSQQIVELIRGRGATSIGEITELLSANRNTVKLHLKNLVKDGYLVSEGAGRGVRYRVR